jgi:cell division protein ZapE
MNLLSNDKNINLDNNQARVFHKLQHILSSFDQKNNIFSKFFKKNTIKSLYIYGNVGRGKSMLMKYFFDELKYDKIYFHFNDFMQNIHHNLRLTRNNNHKNNKKHILETSIGRI